METMDALIISRAIERIVFMLCAPLLLYLGYRLMARALDHNDQARAELRDKYKLQAASLLPGGVCVLLAVSIGFAIFRHPLELPKAEQDLRIKLDQIGHPVPPNAAPHAGPEGVGVGGEVGPAPKPSLGREIPSPPR